MYAWSVDMFGVLPWLACLNCLNFADFEIAVLILKLPSRSVVPFDVLMECFQPEGDLS